MEKTETFGILLRYLVVVLGVVRLRFLRHIVNRLVVEHHAIVVSNSLIRHRDIVAVACSQKISVLARYFFALGKRDFGHLIRVLKVV